MKTREQFLRKIWLCAVLGLLTTGCMTQQVIIPPAPRIPNLSSRADAPVIGMAPVKDERIEELAGSVGALKIAVGQDLLVYIDAALKKNLIETGYNVVAAPNPTELGDVALERVFNGEVITVSVVSVSFSAADSLLFPADCEVSLLTRVFDRKGALIYSQNHTGENKKVIGFSGTGKKEGKIIAAAAERAVESIFGDQKFLEVLK